MDVNLTWVPRTRIAVGIDWIHSYLGSPPAFLGLEHGASFNFVFHSTWCLVLRAEKLDRGAHRLDRFCHSICPLDSSLPPRDCPTKQKIDCLWHCHITLCTLWPHIGCMPASPDHHLVHTYL